LPDRIEYDLGAIEVGMVAHMYLQCRGVRAAYPSEPEPILTKTEQPPEFEGLI
jgi:hypothetical protein